MIVFNSSGRPKLIRRFSHNVFCTFVFCVSGLLITYGQAGKKDLNYIIRGKISERNTGELLQGASVYIEGKNTGTTSNNVGEYFIHLPEGEHTLYISSVGYETLAVKIDLQSDTILHHKMDIQASSLEQITIEGRHDHVNSLQMSHNSLNLITLRKIPPLLGEPDIIRGLLLMPGVSTVGEGATGYNVRGGGVDQNLILLDDAPIFNTSHLFGFLTSFNSNAVLSADLYKGGIPATYGGRVASVLDIRLKHGNKNKFSGEAAASLISATVSAEGPIIKDRTTFMVSARTSYSDWLLKTIRTENLKNSNAGFFDGTIKLSHQLNSNHLLTFSGYKSHDDFKFPGDTTYSWSHQNMTLKLGSTLSNNLFLTTALVSSEYDYIVSGLAQTNEFSWTAGINYKKALADLSITVTESQKSDFSLTAEWYRVNLGNLEPGVDSNINPFVAEPERGLILSAAWSHEIKSGDRFSMIAGIRGSRFQLHGPGEINRYEEANPKSSSTYLETKQYGKGEPIQQYYGVEPRLAARYSLNDRSSLKASFDRTLQYIHLISNTSAVSPVDLWKLSDPYLAPQTGHQYSVGYFREIKNTYDFSLEMFYKELGNVVDFKDGAELLLNDRLEADLLQGTGRAYGTEVMLEKTRGKFTGWLAYTLSRAERVFRSSFPEESINKGKYYPANFDKTHNIAFTGSYQVNPRVAWGINFVYASGRPVTYPSSSYGYSGVRVVNFEYRNNERSPAYHRLDLSLEIKGKILPERKWNGKWVVSLYNVYARKNPYSIYFKSKYLAVAQPYRLAVIGTVIPSLSYTISF